MLAEAHRILRPGGTLLIENHMLVELLPRWLPWVVPSGWLLAARFSSVQFFDHDGEPLTARSPRMVTIAVG